MISVGNLFIFFLDYSQALVKIALFCESPPPSCTVWVGVLTRSLSAAGSAFPTPKSSAVTSWDVWPWHSSVSRPTSSSPRSMAEATMVRWSGRRRLEVWAGQRGETGAERSQWVHRSVLPPPPLIPGSEPRPVGRCWSSKPDCWLLQVTHAAHLTDDHQKIPLLWLTGN